MTFGAPQTRVLSVLAALVIAALASAPGHGAIKNVPYPEVTVEIAAPQPPEPAFLSFFKEFADAVANRNAAALFALVGPTFVWTVRGALTDEFDPGRDALHNFKVVFGFRAQGKDEDGAVENGPFWDELAQFARDQAFYGASDSTVMICGTLLAES